MRKDIPLWAVHLAVLFTAIVAGVFPGQYLAANTNAGHHNAPALTAAFYTLSVVGVVGAVAMVCTVIGYLIADGYKGR